MKTTDPFKKAPNRIGELISLSDKTLKEISKEVNINYETLSAYKRQIRHPKKDNTKKLADYFGVSIPYLLGLDDSPTLIDPGTTKEVMKGFYKIITKGTNIENKITKWTPFGDELALILKELNQSNQLADYIDFIASKKDFNPVLVKAVKQFIADQEEGLIPFLINKSSGKESPYHYVWQAWTESDEYKKRMAKKQKK